MSGFTFVDSSMFLILMDIGKYGNTVPSLHSFEVVGNRPIDQSCHHEAWFHLDNVEWRNEQPHSEIHDRRILLKERSAPYHHGKQKVHISDVMSDHSVCVFVFFVRNHIACFFSPTTVQRPEIVHFNNNFAAKRGIGKNLRTAARHTFS